MAATDGHICEITLRVRYAETDNMGVAHHAAYLVWFEEGRSAYIRERGWSYADIEDSGNFLVAADLKARYLRACRYDQRVTVKTWIEDVKSRAITFGCDITDARSGEIAFSASLKLICLDSRGRITRIPAAWAAWLRG
ncbi:MAG: thioesterase family protein [Chloroflexota bacterium]|nr:thioesterase family protein [Chloroflexota bacterium]